MMSARRSAPIAKGDTSELIEMKAMRSAAIRTAAISCCRRCRIDGEEIFDQSAMRRLARNVTIPNGDAWEEIVDNDEPDAEWVGELQSRSETAYA